MKQFCFEGKRFIPVRSLTEDERSLDVYGLTRLFGLATHASFARTDVADADLFKPQWNYTTFYQAASKAGAGHIDIFRLGSNEVIPCRNYLATVS